MSAEAGDDRQRGEVLAGVLTDPGAMLCALASDGVLVPMPEAVAVPAARLMAVPDERATLLDALSPADSLPVVGAWERARAHGFASVHVRLRTDPDRRLLLTFVDARERHDVIIGALQASAAGEREPDPDPVSGVEVSRRPRTATVHKNTLAVITRIDDRTTRMLGWSAAEMVGKRSTEFLHPDDHERAIAGWLDMLAHQGGQRSRVRHSRADGSWAWVELENQYLPADDPADAVVVTQITDVSDEMAAQEALQARERLLRRVAESLPIGILQLSADRGLVYANTRLATLLGLAEVTGVGDVLAAVAEDARELLATALDAALHGGDDAGLEVTVPGGDDGSRRVCAVNLVSLGDREGAPGALLSLTDVTDSVRMREELTRKATFDVLTGCHNRASTIAILERALRESGEGESGEGDATGTAVVFVDLDRFKPVNDTLGHDAGDELLALTAARLSALLRRDDVVGRIGGDEFLLICRGLEPADALAMGQRVRESLATPVVLTAGPVEMSASIGIACAQPGETAAELVKRADRAMYRSKQAGLGSPVLHDPSDPSPAVPQPRGHIADVGC